MPKRLYTIISREHEKRALAYYRAQNAIWIWVGLAAILGLINWYANPTGAAGHSSLGKALHGPVDDFWVWAMAIGGIFISYGIWRFYIRIEIIGHLFLTSALIVNEAAILVILGPVTPSTFIIGGIAVASGWRVWFLWTVAIGSEL